MCFLTTGPYGRQVTECPQRRICHILLLCMEYSQNFFVKLLKTAAYFFLVSSDYVFNINIFFCRSFFDHSMHSALPLGIYLATKFWMYVTWFFWFWNDILYHITTAVTCFAEHSPLNVWIATNSSLTFIL